MNALVTVTDAFRTGESIVNLVGETMQRHGLDLLVFTEPIHSDSRSASWQKCLTLGQLQQYEQIAILDGDIAINVTAPNVFDGVPRSSVGGVVSGGHIHGDLRLLLLSRLAELNGWQRPQSVAAFNREAYTVNGLCPTFDELINCGVLICSPQCHRELFEAAYRHPHNESRCYEQVPLSHGILRSGLFHAIDSRFNSVLYETMLVHHPYLWTISLGEQVTRAVVQAELANNYFLHFAYGQSDMMRFIG